MVEARTEAEARRVLTLPDDALEDRVLFRRWMAALDRAVDLEIITDDQRRRAVTRTTAKEAAA